MYTKKIQVTSGIFHGVPQESIAQLLYPIPKSSENLWEFPKTSETLQTVIEEHIYKKKIMKILENLWQSSETFGKLRKQFNTNVFMIFLKFS